MTMPRAPSATTLPSKSASPRATVRSSPSGPTMLEGGDRRGERAGADRPSRGCRSRRRRRREMCGSDARLASAQPRACELPRPRRRSPAPRRRVTVRAAASTSTVRRQVGERHEHASRVGVGQVGERVAGAEARTRGAAATSSCRCSTERDPLDARPVGVVARPVRLRRRVASCAGWAGAGTAAAPGRDRSGTQGLPTAANHRTSRRRDCGPATATRARRRASVTSEAICAGGA